MALCSTSSIAHPSFSMFFFFNDTATTEIYTLSLHDALPIFVATTGQSAPLRRIGTFSLAVGAACAFSLAIAGQVLTFRTRARLSFAPPTCRMPLGQSQDIPQADPGGRVSPRFLHRLPRNSTPKNPAKSTNVSLL